MISERSTDGVEDYNKSRTHEKRLKSGPSQRAPKMTPRTSYNQSGGREQQDMPPQGPAAPQPIPKSRHEREEDLYRNPTTISSSPRPNIPPSTSGHYPSTNPSRHEDAMYDSESTSLMSKTSQNYPTPPKGFDHPSRHHQEDISGLSTGAISVNYRQTETSIHVNESAYRLTPSGNQYSTQPRYTEEQRQDVETEIVQALRDRGIKTATRQDVDRLVNEQLGRLYGSQQQQHQQTRLSPSQGGQKPLSGSVPYTQFTGSGGQKPAPGSVPITQFSGSGGQKPLPGSIPYTQFPGSGKPPETTQPDYSGSYGFPQYATSGGPESDFVDKGDKPFSNKPSSQSYDSRSGKHTNRDDKYRKR
jgi:hypothetical protein